MRTTSGTSDDNMTHAMTLLAILKPYTFEVQISGTFWVILCVSGLTVAALQFLLVFCIFSTIHSLIRPLRILNEKMKEIMSSKHPDSPDGEISQEGSSHEMAIVYKVFHDLIQDRYFSQNAFLLRPDNEDVISIMDLAKTCIMYQSEDNLKAAAVCYNNIANLHFKNGKFMIAAQNFEDSISLAD